MKMSSTYRPMRVLSCLIALAMIGSVTACAQGPGVDVSTHKAAQTTQANDPATQEVERVGAIGMLADKPATFEEFLTYSTLDAVVTGKVLSTRVLPVNSPADYPNTVVTFAVEKSSKPEHVKPGSEVLVRYEGARTTKGEVHKIYEVKQKPNGGPEGSKVLPSDKTPITFDMNGQVPPQVGDQLLLFLEPHSETNGDRWVLSGHRGTYYRTKDNNARAEAGESYSRDTEGTDGHLAWLSVAKLNDVITRLKSQRSQNGFDHKPL